MNSVSNFRRQSNLELLRIIAMYMIVLGHFVLFGIMKHGYENSYIVWLDGTTAKKIISSLCILGSLGNGLFFIISGYYLYKKEHIISLKKVVCTTVLYAWLAVITGFIIFGVNKMGGGTIHISVSNAIEDCASLILTPVSGGVWWYITAYALLMIMAPSLNGVFNRLNKEQFVVIVALMYIFLYLFGEISSYLHDVEIAIFYYTVGVYCRRYAKPTHRILYLMIIIIGICVCGLLQMMVSNKMLCNGSIDILQRRLASMLLVSIRPTICVSLFMLLNNIQIRANQTINFLAKHTLGVYLFHMAPFIRYVIFNQLVDEMMVYNSKLYLLWLLMIPMIIFCIGVVVDIFVSYCANRMMLIFDKRIIPIWQKLGSVSKSSE